MKAGNSVDVTKCQEYIIESGIKFFDEFCSGCRKLSEKKQPICLALEKYFESQDASDLIELTGNTKGNTDLGTSEKSVKRKGRPKKAALQEINVNANVQVKAEKISDAGVNLSSDNSIASSTSIISKENVMVKTENEEMPAPTMLPPRRRKIKEEPKEPKRSTRTRKKKNEENENRNTIRDSDVVIQNATITAIELSDSESDIEKSDSVRSTRNDNEKLPQEETSEEPTRSTRTRTKRQLLKEQPEKEPVNETRSTRTRGKKAVQRQEDSEEASGDETKVSKTKTGGKQKKRIREESSSAEKEQLVEVKKSKSDVGNEDKNDANATACTEYEDARSSVDCDAVKNVPVADATFVKTPNNLPPQITSCTVVLEKPLILNQNNGQSKQLEEKNKEIMTDDESDKEIVSPHKGKNKPVQVFSPYSKTPVKNRVQAFEKIAAQSNSSGSSNIPLRTTRSKTRPCEAKNDTVQPKEKHRLPANQYTPITSKFMPKVCSTGKITKTYDSVIMKNNDSILSQKSASALKASQSEYREREKRRLEKENEAKKKKDAMLQAMIEEKRKKREEKQLKAQQQREALEKDKLKQLEQQKLKEEKLKQALAEKEEKLQKQKEEHEKKRLLAKKKAMEQMKIKEEQNQIREEMDKLEIARQQRAQQKHEDRPIYMLTKAPKLPTPDCYDSDDPEFEKHRYEKPSWSRDIELKAMQYVLLAAGDRIKNTLFSCRATTVDLREIFENIDPSKLKRTSSANWRQPPRFTKIPNLEESRLSEDDEDY